MGLEGLPFQFLNRHHYPMKTNQPTHVSINEVHLSEKTFKRFSTYIQKHYGIQLPGTKITMLEGRLRKRLRELKFSNFEAYAKHVFEDGNTDEMINMVDVVTTNKTDFFREPKHFEALTESILPDLLQHQIGIDRPLQLWCAASSTGEEPYTLAMVISEFAAANAHYKFKIRATDLSTQVLRHAHHAVYSDNRIGPITLPLRKKYLLRSKDKTAHRVRFVPKLRHAIQYQRLNLLSDPFPSNPPPDIIFCRNVFIYFDRATQEDIVKRMCAIMRKGSYLFIGHSETLNGMDIPLQQLDSTIYKKI
jgi:chemotaxis protein methyltransferase CheR